MKTLVRGVVFGEIAKIKKRETQNGKTALTILFYDAYKGEETCYPVQVYNESMVEFAQQHFRRGTVVTVDIRLLKRIGEKAFGFDLIATRFHPHDNFGKNGAE